MTADGLGKVEFSRPVDLTRLGDTEAVHEIEAAGPELSALADRLDLIALRALRATVRLRRIRGGAALQLSGRLSADVTQACVVTLDPVDSHVEEEFAVIYADDPPFDESSLGADGDVEWPEPMPDGTLDVGEAVAQQLSLALDPYPRAPGAALESEWAGNGGRGENPFARLAQLRKPSHSSG
jgi:hypothetical protein